MRWIASPPAILNPAGRGVLLSHGWYWVPGSRAQQAAFSHLSLLWPHSQQAILMMTPYPPKSPGSPRAVVVIGASAGGVAALLALAKALPADFPAPVFIVLHVGADSPCLLPQLLSAVAKLPARHPQHGELTEPGVLYVAPPAHQMLLEGDRVLVTQGPPENHFRPSIDALFRSAARTHGRRVIGVVLTGFLNDGALGLRCVQQYGGLTIVQDPHDAEQPAMPTNALALLTPDYIVPLAQLAPLLVRLTTDIIPANRPRPAPELGIGRGGRAA